MNRIVSFLLILAMIVSTFTLVSCTNHTQNAQSIEANINYALQSGEPYLIGTASDGNEFKVWVEMTNDGMRFILLQSFSSSSMFDRGDLEIDISKNDDLKIHGNRLFLEYGETITGVFDFDISNPLWQGGVVHLFTGKLYYLTSRGKKIELNLK